MITRWILIITLINCVIIAKASIGDRTQFYRICMEKCLQDSCDNGVHFREKPSLGLQLLSWTCMEDCRYMCMWETVDLFTSKGLHVPQFHGKWPFVRIFGLQEPASVIFSVLNFYAHASHYLKFRKRVSSSSPMFFVWSWFTTVCLHGWFWSTIFHARDTDFTEVMDYSCAFTIVLTLLYCLILRISCKDAIKSGIFLVITCIYLALLYTHLTHLWSGRIDYGYNMQFNVIVGLLTFIITMVWWYRSYKELPHMNSVGWFTVLTVSTTLLELADFPPFFWIFDAHSLWHASTVPLVNLLYRFISLDCQYLRRQYSKLEADRL